MTKNRSISDTGRLKKKCLAHYMTQCTAVKDSSLVIVGGVLNCAAYDFICQEKSVFTIRKPN